MDYTTQNGVKATQLHNWRFLILIVKLFLKPFIVSITVYFMSFRTHIFLETISTINNNLCISIILSIGTSTEAM
jgi:hypothetical protein